MNYKAVINIISRLLLVEAALMLLPVAAALIYSEEITCFLIPILMLVILGSIGTLLIRTKEKIYSREGFVIVALSWVIMSAIGCLPFVLSGHIPSYIDAFFETVSGFTTTGASILTDVEALPQGLLFWRSFTHWVGGMGVLVFVMAIMPLSDVRSVHIMRAEVPGPTKSKLVPRMRNTASILYKIYIALTVVMILLLLCGNMPFYDALITAFGTAGTGGFSNRAASIGAYNSAYVDIIVGIFMLLFGINFNLYYLILIGEARNAFKSEELKWYVGIVFSSVMIITLNIMHMYDSFGESLRHAFFQVSTIVTTTGFATVDFNLWPSLSKMILLMLMVIGGCAGSTGGGIKVSRVVIAFKSIFREIRRLLHPHGVNSIRMDDEVLDKKEVHAVMIFIVAYFFLFIILSLIVCLDGFDLISSCSAVIACISNIGPGFEMVGATGNFAAFSPLSKIALSIGMLLGRLEIFPILMIFMPSTWRRT